MSILISCGLAAAISGAVMGLACGLSRRVKPAAGAIFWPWAVAGGIWAGAYWLGRRPGWPPETDMDRLLYVALPVVVATESVVASGQAGLRLVWLLRSAVCVTLPYALLYGSVYLDPPGASASGYIAAPLAMVGLLGVTLFALWLSTTQMAACVGPVLLGASLPLITAVTGAVVIASGYLTAGQIGLVTASAWLGALAVGHAEKVAAPNRVDYGLGWVAWLGVIFGGRFFAELPSLDAILLASAPLWLTPIGCLPSGRRRARGMVAALLLAVPLSAVSIRTVRRFQERAGPAATPGAPSFDAYRGFRPAPSAAEQSGAQGSGSPSAATGEGEGASERGLSVDATAMDVPPPLAPPEPPTPQP